jgi:hypothetical protein
LIFIVAAGALASGATAHPPSGFAEQAVADGHTRSLDNVVFANVGGNPLLFVQGCFGHPAVGSLAGYQNETSGVFFKVPSTGAQAQVVFTQGSIAPPVIPNLVSDGALVALATGQQPTVGTIDFPDGSFLLAIGFDPKALPGTAFTRNAIAINVKNASGNALPGSPIVSLNGDLAQMTTTGQPSLTPPRFPQSLHWDCDKVNQAEKVVNAMSQVFPTVQRPAVDKPGTSSLKKYLQAVHAAQAAFKRDDAALERDDYIQALDTISEATGDLLKVKTAATALAPHITSPAARRKFLKAEQKAVAQGNSALAAVKGAVTVT